MSLPAIRAVPRTAARPFTLADVITLRTITILHDMAGCSQDDCPVDRLAAFLDGAAAQLRELGAETARVQLWASLHTLTA